MKNFRDAINKCKLFDGGYTGSKSTWRRGRNKRNHIYERLNRYMINNSMAMATGSFKVTHLNFLSSDHRPIVASWEFLDETRKVKNYGKIQRFEEGWLKFKETKDIVKDFWRYQYGGGTQSLSNRIKESLTHLHKWNRERLKGSIKKAISRQEEEIQRLSCEDYDLHFE